MTGRTNKTGNDDNSKENKNNNSGCLRSAPVTIIVSAAILFILTSFTDDYSAMYFRYIIGFFTIFALILVALITIIDNSKDDDKKNGIETSANSETDVSLTKENLSINQTARQSEKKRVQGVAIFFGIIGIIVTFIYSHRDNAGVSTRWKYLPKPEESPISEIITDHFVVIVKTESENDYVARPDICYQYCWEEDINYWVFKEEDATNDPSCPAKSQPQPPPEEQIRDEFIFRLCKSDGSIREMRIVIADNGDLWVWQKWIDSTYGVISRTISNSIFVAPVFALLGVLLYKIFRSLINQGKN
jgi:hypothetical protein